MSKLSSVSSSSSAGGCGAGGVFSFSKFSDVLNRPEHRLHPRVDFDWSSVAPCDEEERRIVEEMAESLTFEFLGRLLKGLATFFTEGGRSKVEGAGIRAYVFAWSVLEGLGDLSQTELAALLNRKHKQSIGREVSKFRDVFGFVCGHMQSEKARQACRVRAARASGARLGFAPELKGLAEGGAA